MTDQEKRSLEYTLQTHKIEGMAPSKTAIQLCTDISAGRLTADAAVKRIEQKYGVKGKARYG